MFSIIVAAHGNLAASLMESGEMISGEAENVYGVEFRPGENTDTLIEKYNIIINGEGLADSKILFLVDLFGGSPYNAASMLAMKNENIDIITGVNLPIYLETKMNQNSKELEEVVSYIKEIAPSTVVSFKDLAANVEEDDLDED
ncbi:PTS sugar transporter subunit IIA [Oceanobacillus jeddahense]|uniref:Mannose/fructose/sorbose PTS transporter subunit IIA n=1 Tax=Oceanobacillus jeddahense TaxID=1462527 RepID=A0ABY5JUA1_9BACI|nr:mannose/fructose/sorbose PTS transporter subunit IIA [Oceanobacillus jeddahense]UUI03057.1 mannose/fructose/sorbose PTS transporter subunit IIA [Oceanobacillus jeddahense]